MPQVTANGIQLEYETLGDPKAPPVLLIMGLGAQLIRWPDAFCQGLLDGGYRVIRYDNRDIGLSSKLSGRAKLGQEAARALLGLPGSPPYTLFDMADDAVGLLDALCVPSAHVIGASMGGTIAQIIAAHYPERTRSLTSIMSSSGNPMLPPPTPAAALSLFAPLPATPDRQSVVQDAIARFESVASPAYPTALEDLQILFGEEYDRGFYPQGVARQLGALIASGDHRPLLRRITCPTVVLHGKDDPLIQLACGEDVANNIPDAELRVVEGMGHDFPVALTETFADAICQAAARSAR